MFDLFPNRMLPPMITQSADHGGSVLKNAAGSGSLLGPQSPGKTRDSSRHADLLVLIRFPHEQVGNTRPEPFGYASWGIIRPTNATSRWLPDRFL